MVTFFNREFRNELGGGGVGLEVLTNSYRFYILYYRHCEKHKYLKLFDCCDFIVQFISSNVLMFPVARKVPNNNANNVLLMLKILHSRYLVFIIILIGKLVLTRM